MKYSLFFILCLITFNSLIAQEADLSQIKKDIEYLASDELEGRETGTKGEELAAQFIADRMKDIGLQMQGENEEYFQIFTYTPKANPHAVEPIDTDEEKFGTNVIGWLDNKAGQTIIIGAHYDHLGHGNEGSLHAEKDGQIHNGADDNASGVALMLQLAASLQKSDDQAYDYLFMAFSGEEKGLYGSNYFSKHPTVDLDKVNYMINFDMVGRYEEDKGLAVNGVGTSPEWKEMLEEVNHEDLKLILGESGVGPSDHTSFYLQDIPVLHFFTGQHDDYHKPTDDFDKINYEGISIIHDMVYRLIEETNKMEQLEFTKTKDDKKDSPRFTVTLGVMPDYMYDGEGMRIDGIIEDRPAQHAGFEKGDVVIKMGEVDVKGMQTYMEALSQYQKGDKAMVKVKRGEEVIEKEVQF